MKLTHARPGSVQSELGILKSTINRWIAAGKLSPIVFGGDNYVSIEAVKKLHKTRN